MKPISVTLYQCINGETSINHAVQVAVSHVESIEVVNTDRESTIVLRMASGNKYHFPYDSNYQNYIKLTNHFKPITS